jgi:2-dehydro-3-deoxyphosphogluconate aldolase/(4S)-4-hydroxy-2-oxoglutarate aldolase
MNKQEVLRRIKESGIVPVIRASSPKEAENIVETVLTDGFKVFEITMTVPDAPAVIKRLSEKFGDEVVIGAGTVLDAETARHCLEAGAKFIVTPCLIVKIIEFCKEKEILICAGTLTPTEIYTAWAAGADVVKVFPVSAMGGAKYIKSLKAPFPYIELMPTGGLKMENSAEFSEAGAIAIGFGVQTLTENKI